MQVQRFSGSWENLRHASRATAFEVTMTWFAFAALAYAVGGVFMKASHGATRLGPTFVFLALFGAGALAQARGMRDHALSTSYILVLGLEAIAAVLLGTLYMQESLGLPRLLAMCLIVGGVAWLRVL